MQDNAQAFGGATKLLKTGLIKAEGRRNGILAKLEAGLLVASRNLGRRVGLS